MWHLQQEFQRWERKDYTTKDIGIHQTIAMTCKNTWQHIAKTAAIIAFRILRYMERFNEENVNWKDVGLFSKEYSKTPSWIDAKDDNSRIHNLTHPSHSPFLSMFPQLMYVSCVPLYMNLLLFYHLVTSSNRPTRIC